MTRFPPFLRSVASRFLAACLFAGAAFGQCEPEWAAGDGPATLFGTVQVTTTWDPDGTGPLAPVLVAAGSSGQWFYGLSRARVATFDGTRWQVLGTLDAENVMSLAVHNGQLWASTVHAVWRWDGSVWQQMAQAEFVLAMTVFHGDLHVGGQFTTLDGVPMAHIARWNGSSWLPVGAGVNGTIWAMVVFQDRLYVGGGFTSAGGVPVGNLAVWTGTTWVATATVVGGVQCMAVRIGQAITTSYLFLGGTISSVAGTPVHNVARYSPATNTWTALGAGTPGTDCRRLFVRATGLNSYELTAVAWNLGAQDVLRWDAPSATWIGLGVPTSTSTNASSDVAWWNGEYVVGRAGDADDQAIQRVTAGGTQPLTGAGIGGRVFAALADGDGTVIGGDFASISGLPTNGIAREAAGGWSAFGGGVDGVVCALVRMPNGDLIAGGSFLQAGGQAAANIARWNGSAWSPLGSGTSGPVCALAVLPNGDLVAGGWFTHAGGGLVHRIARWNGATWTSMGVGFDGDVWCLHTLRNGDLVAGGDFTNQGQRIARWNGVQWLPMGAGAMALVTAVTESAAGDVIAAGGFGTVAPVVVRWDGTTWHEVGAGSTFPLRVHALQALPDGDLVAVGEPRSSAFVAAQRVQRYHAVAWTPVGIATGTVRACDLGNDGVLRLGGDFDGVHGSIPARFASLVPPCPAAAVSVAAGCPSSGGPNQLVADSLPWVDSTFRASATGLPTTALVVAVTGFQQLQPPLPLAVVFAQGGPGCQLHVFPDLLQPLLTTNGTVTSELFLPNVPPLVGVTFHHQLIPFEVAASGDIVAVTATNALRLTGGIL